MKNYNETHWRGLTSYERHEILEAMTAEERHFFYVQREIAGVIEEVQDVLLAMRSHNQEQKRDCASLLSAINRLEAVDRFAKSKQMKISVEIYKLAISAHELKKTCVCSQKTLLNKQEFEALQEQTEHDFLRKLINFDSVHASQEHTQTPHQ